MKDIAHRTKTEKKDRREFSICQKWCMSLATEKTK